MKKLLIIFLFINFFLIQTYPDNVNFNIELKGNSENSYFLKRSWNMEPVKIDLGEDGYYNKNFSLEKDNFYFIEITKDNSFWYSYKFDLKKDLKLDKDLEKASVNLTIKNKSNKKLDDLYVYYNRNLIPEKNREDSNIYFQIDLKAKKEYKIYIKEMKEDGFIYGPVKLYYNNVLDQSVSIEI